MASFLNQPGLLGQRILNRLKRPFLVTEFCFAQEEARRNSDVQNVRVLFPAGRVDIASPSDDPFVPVGKYYREGWFKRPAIFTCELPDARVHVPSGLVCTRRYRALADVGLEHRLGEYGSFGKAKGLNVPKWHGLYSTINYSYAGNPWHWVMDSVMKVHSLAKSYPETGITFLMPEKCTEFQRETLRCVIPPHFKIEDTAAGWVRTERFAWASLVSGRCIGLLPREYYAAFRDPIFRELGLTFPHQPRERLYISRGRAKHRRVTNEPEVMKLLEPFGFRLVAHEDLSFRQEVELFHRAGIVIGAHGAGLISTMFSGNIPIIALYPNAAPSNYFHTQAIGLGQTHHFVRHQEPNEDSNFAVDLVALEKVLTNELRLRRE